MKGLCQGDRASSLLPTPTPHHFSTPFGLSAPSSHKDALVVQGDLCQKCPHYPQCQLIVTTLGRPRLIPLPCHMLPADAALQPLHMGLLSASFLC